MYGEYNKYKLKHHKPYKYNNNNNKNKNKIMINLNTNNITNEDQLKDCLFNVNNNYSSNISLSKGTNISTIIINRGEDLQSKMDLIKL